MMKFIFLALLSFPAFASQGPTALCQALNSNWSGEGSNVYYGPYEAKWTGTCDLSQSYEFLKGELSVRLKQNPMAQINFKLSATRYTSSFTSPIVIKLTELNSAPALNWPGMGEEETLLVSRSLDSELHGWRQVDITASAKSARGLRLVLDKNKVLNFGFIFSQTFCDRGDGAYRLCVSDRYLPFLLQTQR